MKREKEENSEKGTGRRTGMRVRRRRGSTPQNSKMKQSLALGLDLQSSHFKPWPAPLLIFSPSQL